MMTSSPTRDATSWLASTESYKDNGGKQLEYSFAALSLTSSMSGTTTSSNRQPALSVSTLSTLEEDTENQVDGTNLPHMSPHSPTSPYIYKSASFPSPIGRQTDEERNATASIDNIASLTGTSQANNLILTPGSSGLGLSGDGLEDTESYLGGSLIGGSNLDLTPPQSGSNNSGSLSTMLSSASNINLPSTNSIHSLTNMESVTKDDPFLDNRFRASSWAHPSRTDSSPTIQDRTIDSHQPSPGHNTDQLFKSLPSPNTPSYSTRPGGHTSMPPPPLEPNLFNNDSMPISRLPARNDHQFNPNSIPSAHHDRDPLFMQGGAGSPQALPYDQFTNLQSSMRQRVMSADRVYSDQKVQRVGYINSNNGQYGMDGGNNRNLPPFQQPNMNGQNFNRLRSYSCGSQKVNNHRVNGLNQNFVPVHENDRAISSHGRDMQPNNGPRVNGDNYNDMYLSQPGGLRGNGMNNVHFRNENHLGTIGHGNIGSMPQSNNDVYNNPGMKPLQSRPQLMPLNENRGLPLDEHEHMQGSLPNISHLRNMTPNVYRSENEPIPSHQMLKTFSPHAVNNLDTSNFKSHVKPNELSNSNIYTVKFKRTQRSFILGPRMQRDAKVGSYVKVEADRGEDLGIVTNIVPSNNANNNGKESSSDVTNVAELKKIIRLATNDEITLLTVKRKEEDELLKMCRGKTIQRALPMNVVDAEYQFDRNKLTFFFQAEGRVDFRELVRDLFSLYKTRIWMQQIDKAGAPPLLADTQAASNDPSRNKL